jgi:large subunit ribosomal protein L28
MKSCYFTGKTRGKGMKVSHSHRRSPRILKANLQRRRVKINGRTQRIWVSTRAIKAGKLAPYLG